MSNIFPPGAELAGRYRILRLAASRGICSLFEAESLAGRGRVAFKWLRFGSAQRVFALPALEDALRALRVFAHPNALDVYDVVGEGSSLFVAAELASGEPLLSHLAPHALSRSQRIQILLHAMRAVVAAHASGLAHGGLHPGNIFFSRGAGEGPVFAKVLDFATSHFAALECAPAHMPLSRAAYRDRDQLCGASELDARADVYAFGVMSYQVLTDRLPYVADNAIELAGELATSKAPSVAALRPELPSSLDRALASALAGRRTERPATLHELIAALEALSDPTSGSTPPARTRAGTALMVVRLPDPRAVSVLPVVKIWTPPPDSEARQPPAARAAPAPAQAATATKSVSRGRARVPMLALAACLAALGAPPGRPSICAPEVASGIRDSREVAPASSEEPPPPQVAPTGSDASAARAEESSPGRHRRAEKRRRRVLTRALPTTEPLKLPNPDQFRAGVPPGLDEF